MGATHRPLFRICLVNECTSCRTPPPCPWQMLSVDYDVYFDCVTWLRRRLTDDDKQQRNATPHTYCRGVLCFCVCVRHSNGVSSGNFVAVWPTLPLGEMANFATWISPQIRNGVGGWGRAGGGLVVWSYSGFDAFTLTYQNGITPVVFASHADCVFR